MIRNLALLITIYFSCLHAGAQIVPCTTLGQNPSTAFPVCGTDTFSQSTVPYCGGKLIEGTCPSDGVADANPFWYKFTCFTTGTLGFLITPNDLGDDYDWEIFDITNHSPDDIYTIPSLFVACNWSGITGLTGASAAGTSLQNCAGFTYPPFSAMPTLIAGHNYLLLVSHFTRFNPSQNGYKLSFGGGTASITDTLLPGLVNGTASCDAMKIAIRLNKGMKCNSLSVDGSEFFITPAAANVVGAYAATCSNGFDMDSITLTLNNPLPPGNYTVTIKNGADGNTLLDVCDRDIPPGKSVPLKIPLLQPTPMDSLTKVGCAPQSLQLVFEKKILCSSIDADGSDFIVTGPSPVSVTGAAGNCTNGESNTITVTLSAPIVNAGNYKIQLKQGNEGNTLFDECGQETPAGSSLSFSAADTVSADFSYQVFQRCLIDSIRFTHDGRNGVNQWLWNFDNGTTSALQDPTAYYTSFGLKNIQLIVSNGLCSDTLSKPVNLDNTLTAAFETNNLLCPEDTAAFINKSIGNIVGYFWDFGDGTTSTLEIPPPHHYPISDAEKIYRVSLAVRNAAGCIDTAYYDVRVLKSCYIAVPNAFTPNGDGLNDYLYPLNAYKADHLDFQVYNRFGQLVFHTTDWTKKWDGAINGQPQDTGVYVWILQYTNRDTGQHVFQKGSTTLIR
ncbi:MAG TPA: gliding motility-associated C-terminal domain-containing protein [Chitinophagaceae bacterium]|nr:gliding motility-associated C-terminal domain-containing protein [Chitinophagaceae bacterium]